MTCGIYMIQNKQTGQKYIGQSVDIESRYRGHMHDGKRRKTSYIDNAINKNGSNMFELKIIEELPNDFLLLCEREKYWINFYNTYENKNHYNLTPGGEYPPMKIPEIAKKVAKTKTGK